MDIVNLLIIVSVTISTPLQSLMLVGGIAAPLALPTYLDYVRSGYASEARTVMSNINNASKMYYQTRGEWPTEIDELERAGQLDVSRSTKLKWTFDIQLSDQGGLITASSTEEMSGGAGHQVIYDADLGKFSGYGSPEGE
jgi:type II secretory pathway pseudopilin PulG